VYITLSLQHIQIQLQTITRVLKTYNSTSKKKNKKTFPILPHSSQITPILPIYIQTFGIRTKLSLPNSSKAPNCDEFKEISNLAKGNFGGG